MGDPEVLKRGNEAAAGLTDYFRELVRSRRGGARDDILHALSRPKSRATACPRTSYWQLAC